MGMRKSPFLYEPWKLQAPAFAIADGLYYVGIRDVSCHLLKTSGGVVLIDTAFAETTYLLTESIRSVGVEPDEISLIIHTHGHVDHCGATRRMKELSGADVALGERARTTTVRDVNVYELVRLAREAGLQVGVVLDPRTGPYSVGAAPTKAGDEEAPANRAGSDADTTLSSGPAAPRPAAEEGPAGRDPLQYQVRRLEKKIEAGARYVVTQPAYDEASARELHEATFHLPVPIVLGILPLRSPRHARFLDEQVAGITVPAAVQARLAAADPVAEGVALAAEMVALARRWFAGALLMPPFGHYDVVNRILDHRELSQ